MKLNGFDNLKLLKWVVCTFKVGFRASTKHKEGFFYSFFFLEEGKQGLLELPGKENSYPASQKSPSIGETILPERCCTLHFNNAELVFTFTLINLCSNFKI